MTRCKYLLVSATVAAAVAVCAPAQATTFAGFGASSIVDGNGAFYDSAIPAGTFTDTIDFTLSSGGTASAGIIYFDVVSSITNLTAFFNGKPLTFTPVGSALMAGGVDTTVIPGPQQIVISGTSGGFGSYSGNVRFSSAVPELATWLMMIAGIGFTGLALRRRKPAYTVNYAF